MSSRWTGFFVWALVAASAAFWGLRIFAASRPLPVEARMPSRPVATNSPMTRLFGALPVAEAPAAAPAESERFALQGVIAEGDRGFAIVSIDGQPPRSVRVGTPVEGDTVLLAVTKRGAEFGPRGGPSSFSLELPAPAEAATGTLPAATSNMGGAPQAAAPQAGLTAQQMMNAGNGYSPSMRQPGGLRGPNGLPIMSPRALPQAPQPQPQVQPQPAGQPDEE